jgi:isoleucyl-tRNA synthetase
VDLSNFYLDIAKDRLYISSPAADRRRSCQTVIHIALENLARAIAPVLSHLAEDIWQFLPYAKSHESVFQSGWVQLDPAWRQPDLAAKWSKLRELRTESNRVLEQARTAKAIGSSLQAKLLIQASDPTWQQILTSLNPADSLATNGVDELRYLLLVSEVELIEGASGADIAFATLRDRIGDMTYHSQSESWSLGVADAAGEKCDRCWNYSSHVGDNAEHPLLCERCVEAIDGKF